MLIRFSYSDPATALTNQKESTAGRGSGQESSGLGRAGLGVSTGPGKPGRSVTSYKELIRGKLE